MSRTRAGPVGAKLRRLALLARRAAANFALIGVSTLVALALAELTLRLVFPQNLVVVRPDVWIPVDGLGHQLAPHLDTSINLGSGECRVLTDASGHRIGSRDNANATRDVLFIGDSFIESMQTEYAQTVSSRVEALLSEARRAPVRVVTAAASGWSVNHYRIKALQELAARRYDSAVVFIYVENDLIRSRMESFPKRVSDEKPFRFPKRLDRREWVESLVYPAYVHLRARSHLVVFLKGRLLHAWVRLGWSSRQFPKSVLVSESSAPYWNATLDVLEEIARAFDAHGVPVAFVLIPADYQIDDALGQSYARGAGIDASNIDFDQPMRILETGLSNRHCRVLNPMDVFRERHAQGTRIYGRVDRHFSVAGHDVMARLLTPTVHEMLDAAATTVEH